MHMIIAIALLLFLFFSFNRECYCNQNNNKVTGYDRKFGENVNISNIGLGYDCYDNCINSAKCYYVGLGFDCYDSCFNNVPNVRPAELI